jgi:hypothetical protein
VCLYRDLLSSQSREKRSGISLSPRRRKKRKRLPLKLLPPLREEKSLNEQTPP